jgi:hypothetical protein
MTVDPEGSFGQTWARAGSAERRRLRMRRGSIHIVRSLRESHHDALLPFISTQVYWSLSLATLHHFTLGSISPFAQPTVTFDSYSPGWHLLYRSQQTHLLPHLNPHLFTMTSTATADMPLRQGWPRLSCGQPGGLAARLVNRLFQVCLPSLRLHASVPQGVSAVSSRTLVNNAGKFAFDRPL